MSKLWILMVFVALIASPALSQDRGGKKPEGCDMKSTEKAKYCPKCDKVLDKDGVDKEGKCTAKDCGTKAVEIELCVKKHFCCGCGGSCCTVDQATAGKCKCNKPLKEETDKCKILQECEVCHEKAIMENLVKHNDDLHKEKKDKKCKKVCEKSGTAPHVAAK